MKIFTSLINLLKKEIKYRKLKNMNPNKYKDFLEREYFNRTDEKPNLDSPQKYTEKMQYAKVHLNSPLKTKLSDKYEVRTWVSEKLGNEYLIPLIGVWDTTDEINFSELPEQFVFKMNGGSGTNIIVTEKSKLNLIKTKFKLSYWLNRNFAYEGDIQLQYKDIKPKILAEKYITDSNGQLNDFKFMCFNGIVYFCWIDVGRFETHYRNIYDLEWIQQPWQQHHYENTPYDIDKPKNFEAMIEIASILSRGFSHVRVDLYNVDGKIYFGEMTFTNGSGYELIYPEEYNLMLGNLWDITRDD